MGQWKLWLENRLEQQTDKKLGEVWKQALVALGINGLNPADALSTALSDIDYKLGNNPPIKGGTAALKKLTNAQIFDKVKTADVNMTDNIEQTNKWLNKISNDGKAHGATVGDLMQKMFGEKFNDLSGDDTPDLGDDARAEVPAMPPKPDNGLEQPDPTGDDMQAQGPENPMPTPPMGAQQGLF